MIVQCPHCGKSVQINSFGRKPLKISVKNVCDALRHGGSVAAAASELKCSKAYIFKVLKANGIRLGDVIGGPGGITGKVSLRN